MNDYTVDTFYGLNTSVKDIKTLKAGTSPDSLNWVTSKFRDSIALRRGYVRLGETEVTGLGRVTGLGVSTRYDGVEQLHFSYGQKIKYYNPNTDDTTEISTADILGTDADGEDVWMEQYQGLGGSFLFAGSPNSGVYKIPASHPASAKDQSVNNYRFGVFHVGQNRVFAGQRNGTVSGNNDKTGLYLSYIDKDQLSDFTNVASESVGASGSQAYSGTLAAITGARTAMYVTITESGGEVFKDDRNGNLVGSAGGTGTINYATGAYSVTFNAVTAGAVTAGYYWEDSTSAGLLDFTGSGVGQGKSFRQDNGGGVLQAIFNINTTNYCFHTLKTWQFQSSLDDTESTNLEYRNVGIPYWRAAHQTPDGIIMADLSRANDPKFRKMQVLQGTDINTIEPQSISDELDLSNYGFSKCVAYRWGDYEIFSVAERVLGVENTHNSITFVYNAVSKTWDRFNYYVSSLVEYNGMLIAGDSISNNCYVLFSGFDEDGDVIENYWTSSELNLGTDNLKTCRRMVIDGLIVSDQDIKVEIAYNGGQFVEVFTIEGDASYVDTGINVSIGSATLGNKVIGGGGDLSASPFEVDFPINSDRFTYARVRFSCLGVGFAQINSFTFKDVRNKGRKNIPVRTR